MSCRSDGGLFAPLPAGMCTSWTRRRGLTGESFSCGGGWTNIGMGVGGLWYRMFVEGFSGGFDVAGELLLLSFFSEVLRQISLGQQVLAQLVVGFCQVVRWVFLIFI